MVDLWLTYKDRNGSEQRIAVDKDKFAIGRHSENDLSIADGRLSRNHALIERFGDIFVLSDKGSSNGTEINGEELAEPTALKDGDVVSFGGLEATIEIPSEESSSETPTPEVASTPAANPAPAAAAPAVETGIPKSFFIIAPIFALIVIGGLGILLYMSRGSKPTIDNSDPTYSRDLDSTPTPRKGKSDVSDDPGQKNSDDVTSTSPTPVSSNGTSVPTPAAVDPEITKTENDASAFLRKIAQNDPRAFVIGEPAKIILAKIKSVSGSSALAANIGSARRNSAQIKALAASKNLKPDLLAAAAIAKLGNSSGDVLQTAQSMAVPLDKLSTQLSSELGEECLVMIAAYDQGAAGDFLKMRNMLQDLATKMPDLNRDIRTIWWLKKQNKITDSEYEFAVRFLAVGTIAAKSQGFRRQRRSINLLVSLRRPGMENESWVTGNITLKVGEIPLDIELTVPAQPVKPMRMLPVFQKMANSIVGLSEKAIVETGEQYLAKWVAVHAVASRCQSLRSRPINWPNSFKKCLNRGKQ